MSIVGGIGLLLFALISRILSAINNFLPWDLTSFVDLIRSLTLLLVVIAVGLIWFRAQQGSYILSDSAIVVTSKKRFGGRQQKLYNYRNIAALRLSQAFFARQFHYGDIIVTMDRDAGSEVLRLVAIDHPEDYMEQLHQKSVQ